MKDRIKNTKTQTNEELKNKKKIFESHGYQVKIGG